MSRYTAVTASVANAFMARARTTRNDDDDDGTTVYLIMVRPDTRNRCRPRPSDERLAHRLSRSRGDRAVPSRVRLRASVLNDIYMYGARSCKPTPFFRRSFLECFNRFPHTHEKYYSAESFYGRTDTNDRLTNIRTAHEG